MRNRFLTQSRKSTMYLASLSNSRSSNTLSMEKGIPFVEILLYGMSDYQALDVCSVPTGYIQLHDSAVSLFLAYHEARA